MKKLRRLSLWTLAACLTGVTASAFGPEAGGEGAAAATKSCPTCRRALPATDRFCPIDGVPLVEAPATATVERSCPICQRKYASPARFCSVDGAPLRSPSRRAGTSDAPAASNAEGIPRSASGSGHRSGQADRASSNRWRLPPGFRAADGELPGDALPRTIICLRDGKEMVLVPGGTEIMGDDAGPADQRPAHAVTLAPFYIDKVETSVGHYQRFLASGAHDVPQPDDSGVPAQWNGAAARPDQLHMPVVGVSWYDAKAYAQWAGKSLPSEAQWERAARGRFDADYPRSVDASFARSVNAGQVGGEGSEVRGQGSEGGDRRETPLVSVFSFPAALNPAGCQNMLGNVAEWCRDWHSPDFYSQSPEQEPIGPPVGELRAVRGGSWQTALDQLSVTHRAALLPTARKSSVGFRCVLNLPPSE